MAGKRSLSFILLLLKAVTITTESAQADATLFCPQTWTEGFAVKLICNITASRFSSVVCTNNFNGVVIIKFQPQNSVPLPVCTLQAVTTDCRAVVTPDNNVCNCLGTDNGQHVVEVTVHANRTQMSGGTWSCEPICIEENGDITKSLLKVSASDSCRNISFDGPRTSASSSLTASSTTLVHDQPPASTACAPVSSPWILLMLTLSAILSAIQKY